MGIDFGHSYKATKAECENYTWDITNRTLSKHLSSNGYSKLFHYNDRRHHLMGDLGSFARNIENLFGGSADSWGENFKRPKLSDPVAEAATCYLRGMRQWKQYQPKTGAEAAACLDALCDLALNANDQDYNK